MTDMTETKKDYESNVKCGHCRNVAPMEIVGRHVDSEVLDAESGHECGTTYHMLACPACGDVVVRKDEWGPWNDPREGPVWQVLYPADNRKPEALPTGVSKAYEAALRVRNVDPNAFAVLLGRVLDHICDDREAAGESLNDRLNDLAKKGEIPQTLADIAHRLRDLRNLGAHADLGELTEKEIPILDDLCRAILEYVYSAPALMARVEKRLRQLRSKTRN